MMFHGIGQSSGFIKTIVVIVIALIILGYFGYNVQDIVNSPMVQKNLNYAWDLVQHVWNNYLKIPMTFIWDKIIIGIGRNNLMKLVKLIEPNKDTRGEASPATPVP